MIDFLQIKVTGVYKKVERILWRSCFDTVGCRNFDIFFIFIFLFHGFILPGIRSPTKTIHVTFGIVVLQRHASFVYLIFDFSTLANPIIFFLYIPPYLEGRIFFLVNFFQISNTKNNSTLFLSQHTYNSIC